MDTQKPESAAESAKKPRGKPFQKGNTIGAYGRGGKPLVYTQASLLQDMRHVRSQPASCDTSEGERDCRRWKQTDLKGFLERLATLELAELKAMEAQAGQGGAVAATDEDLGALERMCVQWLEDEKRQREANGDGR
jgi:hypothetical protein